MLKNKHIILGITGGIAAYKAAYLTRLFVLEGCEVKIIMTPMAKEFITPLTLATLSKNPILVDFYNPENGDWNSHVDLGLWADAMVIAPATANTMGKMVHAIADNLLVTTYLSARCPVFVAPAMDLDMFRHPANQKNIETLHSFGNTIIEPETGELASGLVGKGRMAEPEAILEAVKLYFSKKLDFVGKKVLVSAGPTYENLDPVRFIGNYSSGKMGFALAHELAQRGAEVVLVSGPTHQKITHPAIQLIPVVSANDMYVECMNHFAGCQIAIMAAAVADYTPEVVSGQKTKKDSKQWSVNLVPTKDIAAELGKQKREGQILVGFALETENEESNARHKLEKKNLDLIVLNSLSDKGAGFEYDTNKILLITRKGEIIPFPIKAKTDVAADIVNHIINL